MSWLTALRYGASGIIVFILCLTAHNLRVDSLASSWANDKEAAVKSAKKETQDKCNVTLTQSKETCNGIQNNLDTVNARYYSLLKARCGKPFPSPASGGASGDNGTPSADESAWVLSLDQRYLNDKQAAQLVGCQALIRTIYITNGREDLLPVDRK